MQIFSSCKDAIDNCIKTRSFSIAHLYNDNKPLDMHLHDCYEIYYSISGGKQFLIDNAFYDICPGDIFFINQYERKNRIFHSPKFLRKNFVQYNRLKPLF